MIVGRSARSDATFVGLDLAWGERARTGVAVLDAVGRLLRTASVRTDDELDEFVAPWIAERSCVVGIDAPLVVTNPTGRRRCEAELSRIFAPQHAGCYPANLGRPWFADGGRAAAFAKRHALDVDATQPYRSGQRRAIETFPHSAAVALFDLPRVLPYKERSGRTLESRRGALLHLVDLLTTLAERHDGPALLDPEGLLRKTRGNVETAATGAALRRLEDPIDSVLCGYVALLFAAHLTHVFGDADTGAIVTPLHDRHRQLLAAAR